MCILIVVAFVVSIWLYVVIQVPTAYGPCVYFENGAMMVSLHDRLDEWTYVERSSEGLSLWNFWLAGTRVVEVPLYAVFTAVAIPTLLVWRFVPKFPRGHCRRCGYNLKGLTEPRCPECGTGFAENRQ